MPPATVVLISHLASPGQVTGAERSLLLLGEHLQATREVLFVAPEEGRSVAEARALGIPVAVRPWPRLWWASWRASAVATAVRAGRFAAGSPRLVGLSRDLEQHRGAVALVNTLPNVGAAWAARRAGLKVVWRVAEIPGPGPRRRFFTRALEELADEVVTVSRAVADAACVSRARVVPSGVAIPDVSMMEERRSALRHQLRLTDDELLVGHVGQVLPHKGQLELIRAAVLAGTAATVHFAILGSLTAYPAYAREIRAAAAPLGARVHFPGFVPGAAMAVDVLAFTSVAPDPFPLVVLEAMAAGVPVVAFDGGGVPEAVSDGGCGLLVPAGDETGLAHALARIAGDADLRRGLGRSARVRVERDFTIARTTAAYAAILDEARRDV